MQGRVLTLDDTDYPTRLRACLGAEAPVCVASAGPWEILSRHSLSLFCSVRCPGAMILQTYEFVSRLRHHNITLVSGFHSPMEKECLRALSTGSAGIVWCLAKALSAFRLPPEFQALYDAQRLLLFSAFPDHATRVTADAAAYRNRVAAALAEDVFLSHAAPGSHTETFCIQALAWGKTVLTLDAPENTQIIARGAQPVRSESIPALWGADPEPEPPHGVDLL
jgi:predicted Rossmann fold nucleotide-binding protein DprA/Smf involved in DNA uptake